MDIILESEKIKEKKIKYKGFEGTIYEYEKGILLKLFHTIDLSILKNKRNKLEILNSLTIYPKPIALISINGVIKGYLMKEVDSVPLIPTNYNKKKKIHILNLILRELKKLHELDILFGDISLTNILIKDSSIYFRNFDNMKVGPFLLMH